MEGTGLAEGVEKHVSEFDGGSKKEVSRWVKPRKPMSDYPETHQQKQIREAGKQISEKCKGKKGSVFRQCRHEVLAEVFKLEGKKA